MHDGSLQSGTCQYADNGTKRTTAMAYPQVIRAKCKGVKRLGPRKQIPANIRFKSKPQRKSKRKIAEEDGTRNHWNVDREINKRRSVEVN